MQRCVICILLFLFMWPSLALSKVTKLQFEARAYQTKRHPYLIGKRDLRGSTAILWECNWFEDTLYWDNKVEAIGDKSQYRYVSWEWEWGLKFNYFEIGYYHKSQHLMDWNKEDVGHPDKWPIEDAVFFRWDLLK